MPRTRAHACPRPEAFAGRHVVDSGEAELVPDHSDPGGWSVLVNGAPSSYVHLGDPTRLDYEYMQWASHVLDAVGAPEDPVNALHIGGAGCTLARYLVATRPGSRQTVFEIDGALVTLMRQAFGLRAVPGLRIRTCDGLAGLVSTPDALATVVIRDAFDGARVPAHLTTVAFHREAARVLDDTGIYVGNVADTADVRESRVEAAAASEVFRHVALVAEPAQLRGRRYGNVVVVASQRALPEDVLVRRLAGGAVRARLVPPEQVTRLISGVRPRAGADPRAPGVTADGPATPGAR